jgi:hypothetical protein
MGMQISNAKPVIVLEAFSVIGGDPTNLKGCDVLNLRWSHVEGAIIAYSTAFSRANGTGAGSILSASLGRLSRLGGFHSHARLDLHRRAQH